MRGYRLVKWCVFFVFCFWALANGSSTVPVKKSGSNIRKTIPYIDIETGTYLPAWVLKSK